MISARSVTVFMLVWNINFSVTATKDVRQGFFYSDQGYALINSLIKSVTVETALDCAMECATYRQCKSVNYQHNSQEQNVSECHLNHNTRQSAAAVDFVLSAGFTYYEKDPCFHNPCLYAGNCTEYQQGFLCTCLPGYKGQLCEKERLGWSIRNPAQSCQQIVLSRDSKYDGVYWIDPGETGNPFQVYCDMSTLGGGWLLVTNVIPNSDNALSRSATPGLTYRYISNYNDNKTIISATALGQLRQLTNFTQLRFQCYQKIVGRMIHIITEQSPSGYAVVDYFTANSNDQPTACSSFYQGRGDDSYLATRCKQWGYSGVWGSPDRINNMRLHDHAFYVPLKYHWISNPGQLRCDGQSAVITSGDYWKIYVR